MLSIVVPVLNEGKAIRECHRRLVTVLEGVGATFELIFVDDGSVDDSLSLLRAIRTSDGRVGVISLSRNFGHQVAITAGIDHARGEAVVVMDADLQDPPELIPEMIQRWHEGADVVYGSRVGRRGESVFKRATASLFYRIIRGLTTVDIPKNTGDFRLMSRRAVDVFRAMRERHRFVRGMVPWLGFRQVPVPYERVPRYAGETKFPLSKMMRFAADAIFSFSLAPLQVATLLGSAVSIASFLYAGIAVYLRVVTGQAIPGWASLMVAVVFLGGVQLLSLGVIGEYLGRIYDEVKARPLYVVNENLEAVPSSKRGPDVDGTATNGA
jgi:dolichol-phosphate mannosyltransferase